MNISEIIDSSIPELKMTHTVECALDLLDNCKVSTLPVVHNGLFIGIVSEENLFDADAQSTIGGIHQQFAQPCLPPDSSIFDCLQKFGQIEGDLLAVVETDLSYHGVVSKRGLVDAIAQTPGLKMDGAVIILEMGVKDYSLTQIANIVEGNDCQIISLLANPDPDLNSMSVFLKINTQNIEAILRSFDRYDYQVKASFSSDLFKADMQLRYEEFLKYLNI